MKKISTLGEQLRVIRDKSNLSLREVANSIGIDTSLLGKIERNERQATKEQVKLIAAYYQLDEKKLIKELISDQFAYKALEEEGEALQILKEAEQKVKYRINKDKSINETTES